MSGIPWRFDLENMPKKPLDDYHEGPPILVHFADWRGDLVARWNDSYGGEWMDNKTDHVSMRGAVAWCPIDKPVRPEVG